MGSFYTTCSISNMTLTNQKTSILLLSPSHSRDLGKCTRLVVSSDLSQAFYSPFGFPIHGEYDDYGFIVNIERDKNVEMLEKFFDITIEDIVRYIGARRGQEIVTKNKDIFEKLSMTYIRTEVLEYLEKGWDKINMKDPGPHTIDNQLKELLSFLSVKNTNNIKKKIDKLINSENRTKDETKELYELLQIESGTSIRESSYISQICSINMFKELPIDTSYEKDICKQSCFLSSLNMMNRNLIPSNYGGQDNNWNETYLFNDFVSDLLVEDMKDEYDEYGIEYESSSKMIIDRHKAIKRGRKFNSLLD